MTTLVMLAIVVFGAIGFRQLPINALPKVDFPTISVYAALPGASAETMATTVATVLERQFSTIGGLDSMNSSSSVGSSVIALQFSLDRNIDAAAQDVQSCISAALPLLPAMPTRPYYRKVNPADMPILYLQIGSATLPMSTVDEYAETLVAQRISMVDGVAQVGVYGSQKYAVRVQVDPNKLSAVGVGIDKVNAAVANGTVKLPTGAFYGAREFYNIQTNDQLMNAAAFRPLVVVVRHGVPVRLGDLGDVVDSVQNYNVQNWTGHGNAVILAVLRQPDTNTVHIIDEIKKTLPALRSEMPHSASLDILYDRSTSIRESVHDVELTLLITTILVVLVIFLFLRNATATFIPSVSLPASLLGTFAVMALLQLSLDDMSLMALSLCVGFVVDDAIVMLENITRHLELGEDPMTAALEGSREVSFTIVSMTLSLVAVFIPILFMTGLMGRIFSELAITITAAILFSGFVSLTLTPMLCSRFLRPAGDRHGRLDRWLEQVFNAALDLYDTILKRVLRFRFPMLLLFLATVVATVWLAIVCPKGFIPTQDTGQIFGNTEGAQDISFAAMRDHQALINNILMRDPNIESFMSAVGSGGANANLSSGRILIALKARGQRSLSADQVIQELRTKASQIPGINLYLQNPAAIRMGGQSTKAQYQVTLQGTSLPLLYQGVDRMIVRMKALRCLQDPTPDTAPTSLEALVEIDRDKAAALGVSAIQVDQALCDAYGSSQVAQIYTDTNEYQVILEVKPELERRPDQIDLLYVTGANGKTIPLRSFANIKIGVAPLTVTHLGQLPCATISFNLAPGASLSEAVSAVRSIAIEVLPDGVTSTFQGNALAFQSAVADMLSLVIVALLCIYIVLGSLYESFIHPLTILTGLPAAGLGAMVTLVLFGRDLDVYGFLGMVVLIGIVKKNAIMMIDRALEVERNEGLPPAEAIHDACLVRFRPIMMTTVAALMGSIPLATGLGAGGEARQPLGLAVVGGLMVSQLLTLFITPVIYIYFDEWSTALFGRATTSMSHARRWIENR